MAKLPRDMRGERRRPGHLWASGDQSSGKVPRHKATAHSDGDNYTDEEQEFLRAMQKFKAGGKDGKTPRPFPTWYETLYVLTVLLGYQKVPLMDGKAEKSAWMGKLSRDLELVSRREPTLANHTLLDYIRELLEWGRQRQKKLYDKERR